MKYPELKVFFLLLQALTQKLNEFIDKDEAAAKNNPLHQSFIQDENIRLDLRKEDDNENFLQDCYLLNFSLPVLSDNG